MEEKMFRLDEVNFHALAAAVLKNLWVVVLLCISVVLCYSSVKKWTYTPRYTSSATFMVGAKDSTSAYNSLTATQSIASVFVEVFQSNVLREKIQEQMGDEAFTGAINTVTIPETNLLIVSVTSPAPDVSFRGLNLIVENYSSISDYIFSNAQLEVIKDPVIPTVASNPLNLKARYPLLVAITAVLGLGAVVILWLLRDTVQTPKACRRKIDARLLRTIRHEEKNKTFRSKLLKKNTAPLITNPLITKGFIEENLSLCSAVEYHMRKRGQKVLLVTSVGENEGKSTVAANLAVALAQKGKKVLFLDCDFRKPSLHKIFEVPTAGEPTFSDWLLQEDTKAAPHFMELKRYGIQLGISHSDHKHITALINNGRLSELLRQVREEMDFVILDTPPMLAAADAEAIARMADTSVMVVRTDYMPTSSVNDSLDKLRKSAPEVCGIILNNHRRAIV